MLKASKKEDGSWVLNGVKRFITNGDSDIHLVLARSEEGSKDGTAVFPCSSTTSVTGASQSAVSRTRWVSRVAPLANSYIRMLLPNS